MKNLQIDEKKAKDLYSKASSEFKTMLEDSFGKDFFNVKITDRIKSFEDAHVIVGRQSDEIESLLKINSSDPFMKAVIAWAKLVIIAKALNEGWEPNWDKSNEYKYYAWFDMRSGFGLSYYAYGDPGTHTTVGSRLVFKTSALAEYFGKQFKDIQKDLLLIQNK